MSRFVAVFHEWHVDSRRWTVVELKAADMEGADAEAALELRRRKGFCGMDYVLIPIGDAECVPRRLTWRERLLGWLYPL